MSLHDMLLLHIHQISWLITMKHPCQGGMLTLHVFVLVMLAGLRGWQPLQEPFPT